MALSITATGPADSSLSLKEVGLLILLALIQFTFVVDYVIILPLGPKILQAFSLLPGEYGLLISAYTLSAAVASFSSSFVIDKLSRKNALMICFSFFILGNLFCILSNSFYMLMLARIFSGAFGGILSSLVIVYLGDLFSVEKLGRTTSSVMIANGMATILGVPAAIYFSNDASWKSPFYALLGINLAVILLAYIFLPKVEKRSANHGKFVSDKVISFIKNPRFIWPAVFMALLPFAGGASVLPFLSTFVSHNFALTTEDIALMFFCGGLAALSVNMIIGTLIDKFGKQNVFLLLNFFSIIPLLLLTTFPFSNGVEVLVVTTSFFCLSTAKSVSGITLVNATLPAEERGRYITITNSIQLFAGSGATILSGMLLYSESNYLFNFDLVGVIGICATVICIFAGFVIEE